MLLIDVPIQNIHNYATELIDSLFGGNLLLQLLCHTDRLLTSIHKQAIIMASVESCVPAAPECLL